MALVDKLIPLGDIKAKQAIKAACEEYSLVYLGRVAKDDQVKPVKGATFSPHHADHHVAVGTIEGFDITLVKRLDTIRVPKRKAEVYDWLLVRIELAKSSDLPHVLIDTNAHAAGYYNDLFAKYTRLKPANQALAIEEPSAFRQKFSVYARPTEVTEMSQLISYDIAMTMVEHFAQFDVEWFDDQLIVSAPRPYVSVALIDLMLREALWLARSFETA